MTYLQKIIRNNYTIRSIGVASMDLLIFLQLLLFLICHFNHMNMVVKGQPANGYLMNSTFQFRKGPCTYDFQRKIAYCSNRKLRAVPENLKKDIFIVDLSGNIIRTLSKTSFTQYTLLTILDIRYNNIISIDKEAFYPLKYLIMLDLRYNPFLDLSSGDIFSQSKKLSDLYLSGCNLGSMPNDLFTGLQGLTILWLWNNKLSSINFTSCPKTEIRYMNLAYNRIQKLSPNTFKFTCPCKNLDLGNNPIRNIDSKTIAGLRVSSLKFKKLELSGKIWNNLFEGIAHSTTITKLALIDTDLRNVSYSVFSPLQNYSLHEFHLQNNELQSLDFLGLGYFGCLRELVVEYNKIKTINPDFFSGMNNLHFISFKENEISSINPSNSTWNIDLRSLDLSRNHLKQVNAYAFYGLKMLTFLDLSYNFDLTLLQIKSFSELDALQTLNVSYTKLKVFSLHTPLLKSFKFDQTFFHHDSGLAIIPGYSMSPSH